MKKLFVFVSIPVSVFILSSFKKNIKTDPGELAFPVAGSKSKIGSFWGDQRDAGKRKHEGIDIFAKKGTDVVAICDGTITSVGNGGIGGKTIWLRATDHWWTAYYAHLNSQAVYEGQSVKKGDVIGTVGNTGNARHTAAHLHFGIYTYTGAVNPLPYVKSAPKIISPETLITKKRERPVSPMLKVNDKTIVSAGSAKKELVAKKIWTSSFPEKYVCKQLIVPSADPSTEFFVTTRANVVKVKDNSYRVIGKFRKNSTGPYPYSIMLTGNKKLFISRDKKLVNENGLQIGTVVWKV